MTHPPLTPQGPVPPPSVHAPGPNPTRRYPDDPQTGTEPTRGRLRYRPTTLHGGPLHGTTARIYPTHQSVYNRMIEPLTIHLCLGTDWPHWQPTGWAQYDRHDDGTYHWTPPDGRILTVANQRTSRTEHHE